MSLPSPPDTKKADPEVLALARYLRHNDMIKQRTSLLGGQRWDMFRAKRAARALQDPAYEKACVKNVKLPKISTREDALKAVARLLEAGFALNVQKLETEDALSKGLKPQSGIPVVLIAPQQRVGDDEYIVWNWNPTPLMTYVYGVGVLLLLTAFALYQLWPLWARRATYYLSMSAFVLIGVLLVLSVVRIVLFGISLAVLPRGWWLLPNLYADVGFFESFVPLWAWSGDRTLPKKLKVKKRKPNAPAAAAVPSGTGLAAGTRPGAGAQGIVPGAIPGIVPGAMPGAAAAGGLPSPNNFPVLVRQTPQGPVPMTFPPGAPLPPGVMPAGPDRPGLFVMNPMVQKLMAVAVDRAKLRFAEIVKTKPPKSPAEAGALQQMLVKEESEKIQKELAGAQAKITEMQKSNPQ